MFWTKPLFAAKNLVGFDCLIACAALGVQEAEEFLQGFGIRGIPEKSSFPSDPNQIFVPQLVQMMRQCGARDAQLASDIADHQAIRMSRQ